MIPPIDDLPDDALGAIRLVDAYRNYAANTLIDIYGYGHVATIGTDGRLHFFAAPDGHIGTEYLVTAHFRSDANGDDFKTRLDRTPDVKEYILRELEEEADIDARQLTRKLKSGFLRYLKRGYLIAWGRENSCLGEWRLIHASAWQYLLVTQLCPAIVEGQGIRLFDVRTKSSATPVVQRPREVVPRTSDKIVNDRLFSLIAAGLVVPGTKLRKVAMDLQKHLKRTEKPEFHRNYKTIEGYIREQFSSWKTDLTNKAK